MSITVCNNIPGHAGTHFFANTTNSCLHLQEAYNHMKVLQKANERQWMHKVNPIITQLEIMISEYENAIKETGEGMHSSPLHSQYTPVLPRTSSHGKWPVCKCTENT